jgi:hypothetical protein
MNLNDVPDSVRIFGDADYRGKCPPESIEQVTFFNRVRREYPDTWGNIAIHVRNEGKRYREQIQLHKAEGMTAGSPDIIIPARVTFLCELKRRDHTKSAFQPGQLPYLSAASDSGAFACVALGCDAAWDALEVWIDSLA